MIYLWHIYYFPSLFVVVVFPQTRTGRKICRIIIEESRSIVNYINANQINWQLGSTVSIYESDEYERCPAGAPCDGFTDVCNDLNRTGRQSSTHTNIYDLHTHISGYTRRAAFIASLCSWPSDVCSHSQAHNLIWYEYSCQQWLSPTSKRNLYSAEAIITSRNTTTLVGYTTPGYCLNNMAVIIYTDITFHAAIMDYNQRAAMLCPKYRTRDTLTTVLR